MTATEILGNEHRVIEQVLNCLEQIAVEGIEHGQLDGKSARQALDFFQAFADRCHHAKEENCLFPMLEAKGFPPQGGPTAAMRAEHHAGRECLQGMTEQLEGAMAGDRAMLLHFARYAHDYIHLLREHIAKEDQRLFPMAVLVLGDDDQKMLLSAFNRVEHKRNVRRHA
jgi:hemerythrin-like domain-containing protein